jgi:hypothetical protein
MKYKNISIYVIVTILLLLFPVFFPGEPLLFGMILIPIWILFTLTYFMNRRKDSNVAQVSVVKKNYLAYVFILLYIILIIIGVQDNELSIIIDSWSIGNLLIGPILAVILLVSVVAVLKDFIRWMSKRNE